ncbi:MFS transporter [Saccharopolyspora sp. CA-218241]|uniref:MFS transporter n=1 Tax=Saccharopolyspora sp. CA-218241 TaxID=3240027 RepID=UPI003D96ECD2
MPEVPRALRLVFFLNGAVLSSWAPRIPAVKADLALSDLALGAALLGVAAGSVPTLLLTGRLLRSVPAHLLCRASALVFAAGLPLIAAAGDVVGLAVVLVLLGAASGMLDVAMNAAAVEFERRHRVVALPGLHAAYSLGVLGGAGTGAAVAGTLPVAAHLLLVAAVLLGALAVAWRRLPEHAPGPAGGPERGGVEGGAHPGWRLIGVALCALLLEGLLTDWSAVLLAEEFGAPASLAGFGVVVFSGAMAVSRGLVGRVVRRAGPVVVARWAAGALLVAVPIGVAQPSPVVLVGALALAGVGCGPLFPLALSAAGARGAVGGAAATVTAWGYLAHLGGPPLTGFAAEHLGLRAAVLVVGGLAAVALLVLVPAGGARPG